MELKTLRAWVQVVVGSALGMFFGVLLQQSFTVGDIAPRVPAAAASAPTGLVYGATYDGESGGVHNFNGSSVGLTGAAGGSQQFTYVFKANASSPIVFISNYFSSTIGTNPFQLSDPNAGSDGCHISQGLIAAIGPGDSAGLQVAVGNNGIVAYAHAGNFAPIILSSQSAVQNKAVAIVGDGTSAPVLYVNGTAQGASTQMPTRPLGLYATYVGAGHSCIVQSQQNFAGTLDYICIYNRALSAAEIQAVPETNDCLPSTDIKVTLSNPSPSEPWVKDQLGTVDLQVTNQSATDAENVVLSLSNPGGLTVMSVDGNGAAPVLAGYTYNLGTLVAGVTYNYTVHLKRFVSTTCDASTLQFVPLQANVGSSTAEPASLLADNTASLNIDVTCTYCGDGTRQASGNDNGQAEQCDNGPTNGPVPFACSATCQDQITNVAVTPLVFTPEGGAAGDPWPYDGYGTVSFSVQNTGTIPAENVTVDLLTLDPPFSIESIASGPITFPADSNHGDLGTLAPGQTVSITLNVLHHSPGSCLNSPVLFSIKDKVTTSTPETTTQDNEKVTLVDLTCTYCGDDIVQDPNDDQESEECDSTSDPSCDMTTNKCMCEAGTSYDPVSRSCRASSQPMCCNLQTQQCQPI